MDERTKCLIVALEKLAKLGNGEHYGNSDGNMIAREALANYRIHKPTAPASLVDNRPAHWLPKGRTCRSCLHTAKCKQLGIYNPDSDVCDWDPCRYAEYHGDMTPEPMFMKEICEALGWQGGTVHEAIKEIARLKNVSRHEQRKEIVLWEGKVMGDGQIVDSDGDHLIWVDSSLWDKRGKLIFVEDVK